MPNEFEKIIQQKMDELKLVPSEPVWQKVEMQIRKKKDRKRLIFWIPLLALLSGGSLWIGIDHYSNNIAYHKSNEETQKQNLKITPTTKATTAHTNVKHIDNKIQDNRKEVNEKLTIDNPKYQNDFKLSGTVHTKAGLTDKPVAQRERELKENLVVAKKELPVQNEEAALVQTKNSDKIIQSSVAKNNVDTVSKSIQSRDTTSVIATNKKQTENFNQKADSVKQNIISQQGTVSIKTPGTKKHAESKWKYNLIVASGFSGLSRLSFLNVFDSQKSMDALYANSPGTSATPGVTYHTPSPVQKGLSFSIGGSAQKQLSKRLFFSAGLRYNYYSNSILVGNKIRRDTMFRAYPVSQYFTNNAAAYSYSIARERYHNHYHFISVPLTIDWQMFKNLPLNFHTGFSVQQMIQTNALVFDYTAQAYYHNNKAFNKTLLFTEYGLSYSIPLQKKYLAIGPELQYGLTRLEKNNSDHHLFSYGLKAQLQLNKK